MSSRSAGFSLPFLSKFFTGAARVSKAPSGLSNSAVFLILCLYPGFLEPRLVSRSTRMLSESKEQGQTMSPSLFSALSSFFSSLLNVPGPVPPAHTPEMESLLIGSTLACLTRRGAGAGVSLHFL